VELTLLGVRGSTAAPGAAFTRYGGHTSCVAVSPTPGEPPTLVLDAGTGLRMLPPLLGPDPFSGSLLISHLHWDHVQGIPFFTAGDREGSRVDVYVPAQDGRSGKDLVALAMSPPSFPITPDGLLGDWSFQALDPGEHTVEGFQVTAAEVRHKGGRTFGYRVRRDGRSVAYLPDHVASGSLAPEVCALVSGADVLLHDAQFLEPERRLADAYGHSTVEDAIRLAVTHDVGRLVLFHHSPVREDDQLDAIAAQACVADVPVVVAREGDRLAV
jgi:phosphoribosyl 1,2-cyclic phosphodiesterase